MGKIVSETEFINITYMQRLSTLKSRTETEYINITYILTATHHPIPGEVAQNKTNDLLGQRIFLEYFLSKSANNESWRTNVLDGSRTNVLQGLPFFPFF